MVLLCLWCSIVVFLVKATLPFELLWLQPLFDEGATLLFYLITGYKFRPADENPYLAVRTSDEGDDLEEFGLTDDGDIELSRSPGGPGATHQRYS